MSTTPIPHNRAPAVSPDGRLTPQFYTALSGAIQSIADQTKQLRDVIFTITGGTGDLAQVNVLLAELQDSLGAVSSLGDISDNGLLARTNNGVFLPRTLAGVDGNITVANGNGNNGDPQIDLADLADSGNGTALLRITRDAKGRLEGTQAATTTDLAEGGNLYFTDARAQDAVGTILSGAGDVPLAYDDAGNAISASLSATGVAAGTYGDATHVARVTFDSKGRATGVQAVAISASSGGLDSLITDSGDAFMTEDGADLLVA